jgi:hypothetical protein
MEVIDALVANGRIYIFPYLASELKHRLVDGHTVNVSYRKAENMDHHSHLFACFGRFSTDYRGTNILV